MSPYRTVQGAARLGEPRQHDVDELAAATLCEAGRGRRSLWERERAALGGDTIEAAARLAQLWDKALRASWRLGYATGRQRGVIAGRAEEAAAWQSIVTGYAAVLEGPTRAELDRARRPTSTACPRNCGRCSRCIHAEAVTRNLARYRRPDYPGPVVGARRGLGAGERS